MWLIAPMTLTSLAASLARVAPGLAVGLPIPCSVPGSIGDPPGCAPSVIAPPRDGQCTHRARLHRRQIFAPSVWQRGDVRDVALGPPTTQARPAGPPRRPGRSGLGWVTPPARGPPL